MPIHSTADISANALIGNGVSIWHFSHVREECIVGENVTIGRGVYIDKGVQIGANCKVQDYALLYRPARLGTGVFLGPGVILTNDQYPRAVNSDGSQKDNADWEPVGVRVGEGASIGARSVCVAPVEIGAWALVAAGSTVTKDVPAFALVAGTPAKRIGWVGRAGLPLTDVGAGQFECPKTGAHYLQRDAQTLVEVKQ